MGKAKAISKTLSISELCTYFEIPRCTYYRYLSEERDNPDSNDLEIIQSLFSEKKERIGIRQLKMLILRRFGRVISRKKIARIKRKYGLVTKIRKKTNYRVFLKNQKEHTTAPNLLDRKFKREKPDEVYVTDITELPYAGGKKAYLAVFKDLATKEIISSELSQVTNTVFVANALSKALRKLTPHQKKHLMVHSDQGFHFTHFGFRQILKAHGVTQSMSRKANCHDNAPVESFFGYLKDHLDYRQCESFNVLKAKVTQEIEYYNNERPQWDLKKTPPVSYRRHLGF